MKDHDYKDTLNLPSTAFPMRAQLAQREPERLASWQAAGLSARLQKKTAGKAYRLHDGPPYANGRIHNGHALNKILKDVIMKSQRLQGAFAPCVPGWDCHGLPVELNVEKKYGKPGQKLSKEAFRSACFDYAGSQVALQKTAFERLGVLADWDAPYLTMQPDYEANIMRALGLILARGHILKGFKPVHWCLDCQSALAEAEVEYADKQSPAVDVGFRFVDKPALADLLGVALPEGAEAYVPIWTTTPWTLPANQAVALHPEVVYLVVFVPAQKRVLVLAKDLWSEVQGRYGIEDATVLAELPGARFEHMRLAHPFMARDVPLVLGEHVTVEAGTGAVHTAPSHGQDDFHIGKQYDLPLISVLNDRGCFVLPDLAWLDGCHVRKADALILDVLQDRGVLFHHESIEHSYPHCWRHKTPLIFRATPQWFISMDQAGLRAQALAAIETVTWLPHWGKARIASMMVDRPDWCISRQRTWGTPLPFVFHKETGALHPKAADIIERVAERVAVSGMQAWYDYPLSELIDEADLPHYQKATDTLDVWFDSGVSHFAVLAQRGIDLPVDLYLEGSDQHRGWFQSSLLTAVAMYGKAPYRQVLTHGFVLDQSGRKMSKSLGNVIEPDAIIRSMGADVLRLWVASSDYAQEVHLSDEVLKGVSDEYRRIRNTVRFLLANLFDFNPDQDAVKPSEWLALDRFIVDEAHRVQEEIKAAYDAYRLVDVCQHIHQFCSVALGGLYLDVVKDRQYTLPKGSLPRRSCQTAMHHVVHALLRWMTPILSFTADEAWSFLPEKPEQSLFEATYGDWVFPLDASDALDRLAWTQLLRLRDAVNQAIEPCRQSGMLGSSLEADVVLCYDAALIDKDVLAMLLRVVDELHYLCITASVSLKACGVLPSDAVASGTEGLSIVVSSSVGTKCVRCWHRRLDIGVDDAHPSLCGRCAGHVMGKVAGRIWF
jgi:isoleucyl-tRNA synthetase